MARTERRAGREMARQHSAFTATGLYAVSRLSGIVPIPGPAQDNAARRESVHLECRNQVLRGAFWLDPV